MRPRLPCPAAPHPPPPCGAASPAPAPPGLTFRLLCAETKKMATVNIYKDVIQTLFDRRGRTGSSRLRPRARRDVSGADPPCAPPPRPPRHFAFPWAPCLPRPCPRKRDPKEPESAQPLPTVSHRLSITPAPPVVPGRSGYAVLRGPRRWSGGDRRAGGGRLPGPRPRGGTGTCCGRGRSGPRRGTAAAPAPGHPRALPHRFCPAVGCFLRPTPPHCTPPSRPRDVMAALCDVTQPDALGKGVPWKRGTLASGFTNPIVTNFSSC